MRPFSNSTRRPRAARPGPQRLSALFALFTLLLTPAAAQAQQADAATTLGRPALTVADIMQDPETWIGAWPSDHYWGDDGRLYFSWNPQGAFLEDSLFMVNERNRPVQLTAEDRRNRPPRFTDWQHGKLVYDEDFHRRVFARDGDIHLYDLRRRTTDRLTATADENAAPRFTPDGYGVVYRSGDNLFKINLDTRLITQLTDIRSGEEPSEEDELDPRDAYLERQQETLFGVLRERAQEAVRKEAAREREADAQRELPRPVYLGDRLLLDLQIDPTERYVTLRTAAPDTSGERRTLVQNYVTETGYAEDLSARPKVGMEQRDETLLIQDLERDTTYAVDFTTLPGAYDVPAHRRTRDAARADEPRVLLPTQVLWNVDGRYLVVEVKAFDNKDRWLVRVTPDTGELRVLDRQHDEAWIDGPGIRRGHLSGTLGWMPDGRTLYFQSEETGYSHLYTVDLQSGKKQAITRGDFEIRKARLSKDGATWFVTSSELTPFEHHFYRMTAEGKRRTRLTTLEGHNATELSPNEKVMGILQSFSNRPPEIFVQEFGRAPEQVTRSATPEWSAYPWRAPKIVGIEASDGAEVPARVYEPARPNGAAVLFVHGAGYRQNVHRGWSRYYREYMFHNLLADLGYVVLDVDYRGSAGYGRDWRTAIYRHMGGRDLQDFVDASGYVQRTYGIPAERVGIYGGSYGGFITLMALFTEPEHFGAGAALRSVTDWAHYNHWYTSAILNTPTTDSVAYQRSSPIYFAEGLDDPLLITHGIVDTNVQFQDVVRLAQRLIELGKEDWELAIYPVEGHGFVEPSSWTDQYRRILDLFETHLHDAAPAAPLAETAGG